LFREGSLSPPSTRHRGAGDRKPSQLRHPARRGEAGAETRKSIFRDHEV